MYRYSRLPWWAILLIIIAIFVLITPYVSHLYEALREFGGPDG
jgi:hypothetical protein